MAPLFALVLVSTPHKHKQVQQEQKKRRDFEAASALEL